VLELVCDEFDGSTDRRDVHHSDYDAGGIRAHPCAGPTLRIPRLAPFEHDDGGGVGEFATLAAERRRPFPAFLDHPEECWLDDEPTGPRWNANRCGKAVL
jgi:hypothetical protein